MRASVVIPYKQRLETLRGVFTSLAEQTIGSEQFEVVVGAMEHDSGYIGLCREFATALRIVSVCVDAEWNVSYARNLALRQCAGETIVLLDADMALPAGALARICDRYFSAGENICLLGQAIGYDAVVTRTDVEKVEALPYDHYRQILADLEEKGVGAQDDRWLAPGPDHLRWALVWTGLVAVPGATVRDHELLFDECFRGWGREDMEWGYRVQRAGTQVVLGEEIFALHLPHARTGTANQATGRKNGRYLLGKWPHLDVEAVHALGYREAFRTYDDIRRDVATAANGSDCGLAIVRGKTSDGDHTLVIGAVIDGAARLRDPLAVAIFEGGTLDEVTPLIGMALPHDDATFDECRLLPPILRLSPERRDMVRKEAARVSAGPVRPPSQRGWAP